MHAQPDASANVPVGWLEWARLPEISKSWLKAKVDSGARTSAMHAHDIEVFDRNGVQMVQFRINKKNIKPGEGKLVEAELADQRHVRSSQGRVTFRPVIRTTLEFMGISYPIEVTLICRKKMKYRMLIGREALANRFLVDTGNIFLGGRRKKKPKRRVK